MRALLCFLICAAAPLRAEIYSLGADSQPQPGVPKGTVTHGTLPPGKFYPGTPHSYAVYVPANSNAGKPMPFMVFLDGSGALRGLHVPVVLDNLIAKRSLPPMVGIFVDPGVLPTVSDRTQNRYERIFEYDSTSARFSRFLLEELIPEVAKHHRLSQDPNDHGIAGVSTGAVGAFVAAWQRPDQFHRVLSLIGTFVDMKGAEELPSLIRKTEPKPIRILLQDGRNDHLAPDQPWGTFYAGSWPINNQVMFEAFEFAGYDAKLVQGDGAHDTKQGAAMMPEALRWLWADYPKPVTVHEPAAMAMPTYSPRGRVYSIVSADRPWESVGGSNRSVTNATGDRQGNVYFDDLESDRIYRLDSGGKISVFKDQAGGAAVLRFGADGRLYAAQPTRRRLLSFGPSGDERMLAGDVAANDFVVTAKGDVYFVDAGSKRIGFVGANGRESTAYGGHEIAAPAGLSLSPDQAMLVVSDGMTRYSWSFQIANDGSLIHGEPFYRLYVPELAPGSGVAGVAEDATGQVYFASAAGIQVTEQNGRVAAVLNGPEFAAVTSVAFAGKDLDWIYATAGGRLYRRAAKIHGVAAWSLNVPPKPPL